MSVIAHESDVAAARAAGRRAAEILREALKRDGDAHIVLSAGLAQGEVLDTLAAAHGIRWRMVTGYQFSEYVGLPDSHSALRRRMLEERFIRRIPGSLAGFHFIRPGLDPLAERDRLADYIGRERIDVAIIDIESDGSIGFNQPPAEFETRSGYALLPLSEPTRRRLGLAGLFESPDHTPRHALTMTLPQLLKARTILAMARGGECAEALKGALHGPEDAGIPASILRRHARCEFFVDRAAGQAAGISAGSEPAPAGTAP